MTQLKKSYSLTDLTAADDEDDCDGGIQSTHRHAHYSNFFAYCLLFMILNDTWKCVEKKNLDHTFFGISKSILTLSGGFMYLSALYPRLSVSELNLKFSECWKS